MGAIFTGILAFLTESGLIRTLGSAVIMWGAGFLVKKLSQSKTGGGSSAGYRYPRKK